MLWKTLLLIHKNFSSNSVLVGILIFDGARYLIFDGESKIYYYKLRYNPNNPNFRMLGKQV